VYKVEHLFMFSDKVNKHQTIHKHQIMQLNLPIMQQLVLRNKKHNKA